MTKTNISNNFHSHELPVEYFEGYGHGVRPFDSDFCIRVNIGD